LNLAFIFGVPVEKAQINLFATDRTGEVLLILLCLPLM
jgi:hypothetical protein